MEKQWDARDCWFRFLETAVGIYVIDMNLWHRSKKKRSSTDEILLLNARTETDDNDYQM